MPNQVAVVFSVLTALLGTFVLAWTFVKPATTTPEAGLAGGRTISVAQVVAPRQLPGIDAALLRIHLQLPDEYVGCTETDARESGDMITPPRQIKEQTRRVIGLPTI